MKRKLTYRRVAMHVILLTSLIMLLSFTNNTIYAQGLCANEASLFIENFGAGTTPVSNADVVTTALTYKETGNLDIDGVYRVINNTQQNTNWYSSPDHTGNTNGRMLVMNGNGNTFYRHVVNNPAGFQAGYYAVGFFFMNVNRVNNCIPGNPPSITFILEYQAPDNSWVALGGSTVSVPLLESPTWIELGSVFTLPANGTNTIQNLRISINDGAPGVCGNDYAIDDIKISGCASGGPLPVEFLNVSAAKKEAGISIDWSTASETNSNFFDVEKSIDGGLNWNLVSTIKASGNSAVIKKYNAWDTKQVAGLNYYRIKQVDLDGKFKYSYTVLLKATFDNASAAVISNPFNSNIVIDFLSKKNQQVVATLFDVTGKKIATDKLTIPTGASRKTFEKGSTIQKGIYILIIVDENGSSIYKGKLVKQ